MPNARPERIRVTLSDTAAAGSTPLEFPAQRMWPLGLVFAAVFAILAGIAWSQLAQMSSREVRDVFDLMFVLVQGFWVLGWSAGVLVVGALTLLFLFYRESGRLEGARLLHVPRLGPVNIVCEYELARVSNIRLEPAKPEGNVRVRFDYGGGATGFGGAMPPAQAEVVAGKLRLAAARHVQPEAAAPSAPPPGPAQGEGGPEPAPPRAAETPAPPRRARLKSPSGLALVGANMLPLAGVLFFGWDLSSVMVLYWAESAVIGLYTVAKTFIVGKWVAPLAAMFFIGHYGGFMSAHFLFVYGFFIRRGGSLTPEPGALAALLEIFSPLWPALVALFVSHGVSFFVNFVGRREYVGTTLPDLMTAPYKRIMIMHVTLIAGGLIVMALGTPALVLALLVLLKTGVDWRAHMKEHTGKQHDR